jgi:HD domain
LALEPEPQTTLVDAELDRTLVVAADFIDLKSPFTAGHSRGVADLAAAATERLGMAAADVTAVRRAGWVHDLGRTAIPNSVWDKSEPLTRSEVDRIELHPILTEQMVRRSPGLAGIATIASLHHERLDGSGYAKRMQAAALPMTARVLAVADRYRDLTEERAYRPALSSDRVAAEIRRRVDDGRFDAEAADAVAAGRGLAALPRAHRQGRHPAGSLLPSRRRAGLGAAGHVGRSSPIHSTGARRSDKIYRLLAPQSGLTDREARQGRLRRRRRYERSVRQRTSRTSARPARRAAAPRLVQALPLLPRSTRPAPATTRPRRSLPPAQPFRWPPPPRLRRWSRPGRDRNSTDCA